MSLTSLSLALTLTAMSTPLRASPTTTSIYAQASTDVARLAVEAAGTLDAA